MRQLFVLMIALLLLKSPVCAHAVLVSAVPDLRAAVKGPDVPIQLKFNSRIDGRRSLLKLVHPDGSSRALRIETQSSGDSLSSNAPGLTPGIYRLQWQVLSADGHITRGEFSFTIR
jgi:methionine-rich copper-binding protein CopC